MMTLRFFKHILLGLIVMLITIGLPGCDKNSNGDEPDFDNENSVFLTLNIGVPEVVNSGNRTRATSYYYEEPERKNEMLNNLRVCIVNEEGYIEGLKILSFSSPVAQTPSRITFELSRGLKKIYLFGNESSLPADVKTKLAKLRIGNLFSAEDFTSIILNREQNEPFFTTEDQIPMNEFFELNLESENQGTVYFSADLFVTRLAVKYTFICRDDVEDVTVRLNSMAQSEYFLPRSAFYYPGKYEKPQIVNGIAGRYISSFRGPANQTLSNYEVTLTGRTEIEIIDEKGEKAKAYRFDPIYLMETPGNSFSMSIKFDSGEDEGTWFPAQVLPNLPLLPRNTHVVVYMGVKEYILDCDVDVVPYRGCILDPIFGLDPSRYD